MQSLIRSKSAGVTGGRGIAGAGPGRDLLYLLHEGGEACSSADSVLAGADVAGGEVVERDAQAFLHCLQKEPGGVREGSSDVERGDDEIYRVHVGDGVLEEDGLVWGLACDGPAEAGGYVGVQVGAHAA